MLKVMMIRPKFHDLTRLCREDLADGTIRPREAENVSPDLGGGVQPGKPFVLRPKRGLKRRRKIFLKNCCTAFYV